MPQGFHRLCYTGGQDGFAHFFGEFLGQHGEHVQQHPFSSQKSGAAIGTIHRTLVASAFWKSQSLIDIWAVWAMLTHILTKVAKCLVRLYLP